MHLAPLTKNAVEPFKQKQKYFFSKGEKDNLTVFIFGHFKNVHFGKLTPNVFQTFIKRERAFKNEPLYIGFYESLYNYVVKILLKRPQKKPFSDIFQISG
jgi:hypothetical protein